MKDSTNKNSISRRKSSHEAEIRRHDVFYYIESRASMAGTRSVEATRALGGVISTRVVGTTTRVTGGRISFGNGGTVGSPYAFQREIQIS